MEYCYLGNSGLEVARLGLGAIPFGTQIDQPTVQRIVDTYLELGGNLIDTSNIYGSQQGSMAETLGASERSVGQAVKGKRDRLVIATKGAWLVEDRVWPNKLGLSRAHLSDQIHRSLRTLGTDYIDLYQCHVWDPYSPIEETMRVLDDFVRAGKIRYAGVSNWDGWHVVKANQIARAEHLNPLVSNQIWYNLADRGAEFAIIPACRDQKVSIIAWGALAAGFLSGKFRSAADRSKQGPKQLAQKPTETTSWERLATDRTWALLDRMEAIAREHGTTIANVGIRWALQSGQCDVALLGASSLEQFEQNLPTLELTLRAEEVEDLRRASEPPHPYPNCFYDLFCYKESEFYGGHR
jgi:aryl-alcohol dehydrogenase-like predicted oxidoreductase